MLAQTERFFSLSARQIPTVAEGALFILVTMHLSKTPLQCKMDSNIKQSCKAVNVKIPAPQFFTFKLEDPKK
jgi:hypothetical protein